MQAVTVRCRAPVGLEVPEVAVEVFLGPGLPGLHIVGLVETAVKESRDRVRAAIQNSGFEVPNRKIVVSLAPADLPKSGGRYDLAIAIGILCASGQVAAQKLSSVELFGELSLNGQLRAVAGALPTAMGALRAGHQLIAPNGCAAELAVLDTADVLIAARLLDVAAYLDGRDTLSAADQKAGRPSAALPDLADVDGQQTARRALEIAAAGGHHMLMSGPPGAGKSMLAQRLPGLLPPLSAAEALTTAAVYSVRGLTRTDNRQRPFRAPHHSASAAALAGGNAIPRPGEISLAHNGVLFLDELPEFKRTVLETLREPLETGRISIARAQHTLTFPARFQLIAAMNPCPCGYAGDTKRECRCTSQAVQRYRERISGPLLDRIDIRVCVHRQHVKLQREPASNESSDTVRERILAAVERQRARNAPANAHLDRPGIRRWCWPDTEGRQLLEQAAERFDLSHRACDRVLRVARTIADLEHSEVLLRHHLAEALSLRTAAGSTAVQTDHFAVRA